MQQIVTDMRGENAFDIKTEKIIRKHEVPFHARLLAIALAIGALATGAQSSQAYTQMQKPTAIKRSVGIRPVNRNMHRSIWAIRWEKSHPDQAAAYHRRMQTRTLRVHYRHARIHRSLRYHGKTARVIVTSPIRKIAVNPISVKSSFVTATPVKIAMAQPEQRTIKVLPNIQPIMPVVESNGSKITAKPIKISAKPLPVPGSTVRIAQADTTMLEPEQTNSVTLDFVAADINDILKSLAMQTHINVVSGNDVKGNITVSLSKVSLDEALDMITKLSGYHYAKVGKTYVVGSPASIAALTTGGSASVSPVTSIINYIYSDPQELTNIIQTRYPDVKLTTGKGTGGSGGVIVVTGMENDVIAIRKLIVDAETALSRGIAASRSELYKIKYASSDDLVSILTRLVPDVVVTPGPSVGFRLSAPTTADAGGTTSSTASFGSSGSGGSGSGSSGSGSSGGASVSSTSGNMATKPTTYSLLLTGSDISIKKALDILAQVDVKPAQINYEAKITEINLTGQKNLGISWDFSGAGTRIGEVTDNANKVVDPNGPTLGDNGKLGNVLKFGTFGRTALSSLVSLQLNALIQNGDAKLLSAPNISAVDGEQAAVFIGDAVRYISSITQTTTGPTVTTDTVNVGIKLFVNGKVSNDGYVTVNIHPEVSTITGYLAVPGGGSLPQVASREATTTIRVKDGDYIAIGGLINENDISTIKKVPFLGDLPFLGNLFKDSSKSHKRNEIVMFVKVTIQKDNA